MIETSQLQTLVAVTKAKSFSKAAEELGVTQSAISQSIKNLERKLEVKLFKRSGKKVVLTPEGEKLYSLGNSFMTKLGDTLLEIQADKNTMSGKVRIGSLAGFGKSWLAPIALEYVKKYPELQLGITLGFQDELVRDFESYRLDFLILPEEALPNVGERVLLGDEKTVLVFPESGEFRLTKNTTLEELSNYPTILFEDEGDGLYMRWCKQRFGSIPKNINARYIINSHGNMLQAVQKGLGVAVVPKHVIKRSYYKDKVSTFDALLDNKKEVSNGKIYLVYHKGSDDLLRIKETLSILTSSENPLSEE